MKQLLIPCSTFACHHSALIYIGVSKTRSTANQTSICLIDGAKVLILLFMCNSCRTIRTHPNSSFAHPNSSFAYPNSFFPKVRTFSPKKRTFFSFCRTFFSKVRTFFSICRTQEFSHSHFSASSNF